MGSTSSPSMGSTSSPTMGSTSSPSMGSTSSPTMGSTSSPAKELTSGDSLAPSSDVADVVISLPSSLTLEIEVENNSDLANNKKFIGGVETTIGEITKPATAQLTSINGAAIDSSKTKMWAGVNIEFLLVMKIVCGDDCGDVLNDPSAIIGDTMKSLSESVSTGTFTDTLKKVGEEIGVPLLATAIVDQSSLVFQEIVVVTNAPTSSPPVESQSFLDFLISFLGIFGDALDLLIAFLASSSN